MADQVMEIAAYVALAIGIGLLVYHLGFPHLPRALSILRFRRRLRRIDRVLVDWTVEDGFRNPPPGDLTPRTDGSGEVSPRRRREDETEA